MTSQYNAPNIQVLQGNCKNVLNTLAADSVDCIITSPPYWNLRDYGTTPEIYGGSKECNHVWAEHIEPARGGVSTNANVGANKDGVANNRGHPTITQFCTRCGAWRGQLGLEPTVGQYITDLVGIFRECKRVLKDTGALWVNLGDTYNGNKIGNTDDKSAKSVTEQKITMHLIPGIPRKSLCQIPSRFAIAMTDDGWVLRNEIIWHKPNVMPQSCKDRFTVDFEKMFFFTKIPTGYYYKQILEPIKDTSIQRAKYGFKTNKFNISANGCAGIDIETGRNARTVWTIPTSGSADNHCAMYPSTLVDRPIRATCPVGGTVMDIFAGSGTTLAYCKARGINAIGIELNPDYVDIINRNLRSTSYVPTINQFFEK